MQLPMRRRRALLLTPMVFGYVAVGLGAPGWAQARPVGSGMDVAHFAAVRSVTLSTPPAGYQCVPLARLVTAKAGQTESLAARLDGYVVTYRGAAEARFSTGLFSYPGSLEVSNAVRKYPLPRPADPKDQYFELAGLCAVQFAPGTVPDVLAEGYWGGAHCCYGPTLYEFSSAAGSYRVVEDLTKPGVGKGLHWNPNGGFQPERIGPAVVLESSDGAFPYTFGCYACTPAPTRLFTVTGGRLVDVTSRYPAVIRAEARMAGSEALQSMRSSANAGSVEGPLAQWAADECELGQGAQMWRTLESLQAQGRLTAAERQSFNNSKPFPTQLKAFLLKEGYCQGQL